MLAIVRLTALAPLAFAVSALAQTAPLSIAASPDIYKVVAEDALFRVVLATWKPGQKDVQHSHPAVAAYRLTDCNIRVLGGDGKVLGEGVGKAGGAVLQGAIASHSLENIGTSDCQILLVERK